LAVYHPLSAWEERAVEPISVHPELTLGQLIQTPPESGEDYTLILLGFDRIVEKFAPNALETEASHAWLGAIWDTRVH
jgi:hypothetical protein